MEIDHEIASSVVLLLPRNPGGLLSVIQAEYVHEVLFNRLVKLSQKKVWLGELFITIAVDWDVKLKQTFLLYFYQINLSK